MDQVSFDPALEKCCFLLIDFAVCCKHGGYSNQRVGGTTVDSSLMKNLLF